MRCSVCEKDVHPIREMRDNGDGSVGGFISKCPDCGAGLPTLEPITINADASEEIASLQIEIVGLRSRQDRDDAENQSLAMCEERLERLKNQKPRPAPLPKLLVASVFPEPRLTRAPIEAPPTFDGGDFIEAMQRRLAGIPAQILKLQSEERKLRAMLAVADSTA